MSVPAIFADPDVLFTFSGSIFSMTAMRKRAESSDTHGNKKRKLEELDRVDKFEFDVPYAVTEEGSPVSFLSDDSAEEVDHRNENSFISKEIIKLEKLGESAYMKKGMYRCHCHSSKPKGGHLMHLLMHVREVAENSRIDREKAEHRAMLEVLFCPWPSLHDNFAVGSMLTYCRSCSWTVRTSYRNLLVVCCHFCLFSSSEHFFCKNNPACCCVMFCM